MKSVGCWYWMVLEGFQGPIEDETSSNLHQQKLGHRYEVGSSGHKLPTLNQQ